MVCRTCKWLDVALDGAGRRVPRKGNAYTCRWPEPPSPLPDSITSWASFRADRARRSMEPDDGKNCPCYEAIK